VEDQVSSRAALLASISLLVFSSLTTFALIGWFFRADSALTWKSLLTAGCMLLGGTTSGLMWRTPSRTHAFMGIGVMVFSLMRIGPPGDWTWVSFALVAITFILLMPLVHAAIVLRDD
jgi:hypothetical protein